MKYHDISVPIHVAMPVYEGDPPCEITLFSSIERGDIANISRLNMGAHTGTHIDAPFHFLGDGKAVHEIPLDSLIGPALVVEIAEADAISRDALVSHHLEGEKRVLLKTSNSSLWRTEEFRKNFVYIAEDAATYLVDIGVNLVGIDYLSVERYGTANPLTHLTLLGAGVVVLEGLDLSRVKPGRYQLICLPLRIQGGDGSPCRAVLAEE